MKEFALKISKKSEWDQDTISKLNGNVTKKYIGGSK